MSGVRPGDVIAGKFRIERVLGEGGMGYVVAATHLQLGQLVALKFMRDEVCTPEYKSRFLREARNTVRLKSKHVSRVLDVGTLDGGAPYMVMEYLEGTDLSDLLHARGALPVSEACEYIIQACEAISEAHGHGIVHRDLKPANLFLTRGSSGEPVVKVLDFGVSKVIDLVMEEELDDSTSPGGRPRPGRAHPDSVVTKVSDLLGSPNYMAPEQVMSARDADARSDVWSLGVILFRLISGKPPFQATALGELINTIMNAPIPSLRDARPDIPPGLEHVVARCLDRQRERRPDVGELARMLAPYAGPVATPSLERIAILGHALVTAPPPHASGPSYSASGSAWTSGAVSASRATEPKRKTIGVGAVLWGGLVIVAVSSGAMAVTKFVKNRPAGDAAPVETVMATSATGTAPTEIPIDTAPPMAITLPDEDPEPASEPPSAPPSAREAKRPHAPRTNRAPDAKPATEPEPSAPDPEAILTAATATAAPPAPSAGGDIPSTRE